MSRMALRVESIRSFDKDVDRLKLTNEEKSSMEREFSEDKENHICMYSSQDLPDSWGSGIYYFDIARHFAGKRVLTAVYLVSSPWSPKIACSLIERAANHGPGYPLSREEILDLAVALEVDITRYDSNIAPVRRLETDNRASDPEGQGDLPQ